MLRIAFHEVTLTRDKVSISPQEEKISHANTDVLHDLAVFCCVTRKGQSQAVSAIVGQFRCQVADVSRVLTDVAVTHGVNLLIVRLLKHIGTLLVPSFTQDLLCDFTSFADRRMVIVSVHVEHLIRDRHGFVP